MQKFVQQNTDTKFLLLPPQSPNLNGHIERWFRSLKSQCLDRTFFLGQRSLERTLSEDVEHVQAKRNHQGLTNKLMGPKRRVPAVSGKIN